MYLTDYLFWLCFTGLYTVLEFHNYMYFDENYPLFISSKLNYKNYMRMFSFFNLRSILYIKLLSPNYIFTPFVLCQW